MKFDAVTKRHIEKSIGSLKALSHFYVKTWDSEGGVPYPDNKNQVTLENGSVIIWDWRRKVIV